MTVLKNTLVLVTIGFMLVLTSCKKLKKMGTPEEKPVIQGPNPANYVPVRLQSDRLVVHIKYLENTAFMTEISDSEGYLSKVTYGKELPVQVKKYRDGVSFSYADFESADDRVVKIKSFLKEGKSNISKGYYLLSYDTPGKLRGLSYYNNANSLLREKTLSYNSLGNLSGFQVRELPGSDAAYLYTYDTKHAIFKHVKHGQLLFMELGYPFFNHGTHNPLSCLGSITAMENATYLYEYNAENYPSKLSITTENKTQTFTITYQKLGTG